MGIYNENTEKEMSLIIYHLYLLSNRKINTELNKPLR